MPHNPYEDYEYNARQGTFMGQPRTMSEDLTRGQKIFDYEKAAYGGERAVDIQSRRALRREMEQQTGLTIPDSIQPLALLDYLTQLGKNRATVEAAQIKQQPDTQELLRQMQLGQKAEDQQLMQAIFRDTALADWRESELYDENGKIRPAALEEARQYFRQYGTLTGMRKPETPAGKSANKDLTPTGTGFLGGLRDWLFGAPNPQAAAPAGGARNWPVTMVQEQEQK